MYLLIIPSSPTCSDRGLRRVLNPFCRVALLSFRPVAVANDKSVVLSYLTGEKSKSDFQKLKKD